MRAAILQNDKEMIVSEAPMPTFGTGQVLVKVHWASICGTDLHIYLGEFKERVKYPSILGHEFSGVVAAVGHGVSSLSEGDRVVVDPIIWCGQCPACLNGQFNICRSLKLIGIEIDGGFAEYVTVDAEKAFKVPEEISLREAVLAELYALGVHSARKAAVEPGDRVVIIGTGRLGLAVLDVIQQSAAAWTCAVDIQDSRLELAARIGADLTINATVEDPVAKILDLTRGMGVDRVIECVGTAAAINGLEMPVQQAVRISRSGGRIVVMGLGSQHTSVFWKEAVLKELQIMGSRVTIGDFPRALALMARNRFHQDLLISKEYQLDQIAEAFELLESHPERYVKFLIKM